MTCPTCEVLREELQKRSAWHLNKVAQAAVLALKEIADFRASPGAGYPYEQIAEFCKRRARMALDEKVS